MPKSVQRCSTNMSYSSKEPSSSSSSIRSRAVSLPRLCCASMRLSRPPPSRAVPRRRANSLMTSFIRSLPFPSRRRPAYHAGEKRRTGINAWRRWRRGESRSAILSYSHLYSPHLADRNSRGLAYRFRSRCLSFIWKMLTQNNSELTQCLAITRIKIPSQTMVVKRDANRVSLASSQGLPDRKTKGPLSSHLCTARIKHYGWRPIARKTRSRKSLY